MSKIAKERKPFSLLEWAKDRTQRVETEDGKKVTIASYRINLEKPIFGFVDYGKGYDEASYFVEDELFLLPADGLTEFEREVKSIMRIDYGGRENTPDTVKRTAQRLLQLANKGLIIDAREEAYNKGFADGVKEAQKGLPKWRKIHAFDKLPCRAYLYKLAYETENNFYGRHTVDGVLIPNEAVRIGSDTWYLSVDEIKNLPKEE